MQLAYIFDEGGTVLIDGVRGLTTTPVALVGTAEKVSRLLIAEMRIYNLIRWDLTTHLTPNVIQRPERKECEECCSLERVTWPNHHGRYITC